jgi:beta-lactamase class A
MSLSRRKILTSLPALLATPAWADSTQMFFAAHERLTGGRIGLYAQNLGTGHSLAWRADERFVMCSTFKMSLAACVLSHVDKGQEQLTRFIPYGPADIFSYAPIAKQNLGAGGMTVQAMCAAAVSYSDNTCANKLLAAIGGPAALTRFWRTAGDTVTRLDHDEPLLNDSLPGDPHDTTTPAAMAANLRRFLLGNVLAPASRTQLTGWMLNCQTGTGLLSAGLPPGWRLAQKTGNNARDARGDIGIAWPTPDRPILISVYVQGGHPDPSQLPPIFAGIGRLIGAQLG